MFKHFSHQEVTSEPQQYSIARVLLHALAEYGGTEIFAIPGDFVLPFCKVIEDWGQLPFYTLSHEPAVGFAADAAARAGSSIGIAVVTYGAGALNMVNAVACAYAEKSPVVVISGAPGLDEIHNGLRLHHQVKTVESQLHIYKEVTCAQAILNDSKTAAREIERVLHACVHQSRPVYIELPRGLTTYPS